MGETRPPCPSSIPSLKDRLFVRAASPKDFSRHLLLWLSIGGGLVLLDALFGIGGQWWSFWPVAGWGVLLGVHFLYMRALRVDDEWVDDRTVDLRLRSYDLGHITDIEDRARPGKRSEGSRTNPPDPSF